MADRDVEGDRLEGEQPLRLAVRWQHLDPERLCGPRAPRLDGDAVEQDATSGWSTHAVDRVGDLRNPGADEAVEANHLAGTDRDVDVMELAVQREPVEHEARIAFRERPLVSYVDESAAHHELDDAADRE